MKLPQRNDRCRNRADYMERGVRPLWVWWVSGLIGFLLLTLAFVLFSAVRVQLVVEKSGETAPDIRLTLRIHGREFAIPLSGKPDEKKPADKKADAAEKTEAGSRPGWTERLRAVYRLVRKMQYTLLVSRASIRKRLVMETLELDAKFGLSDAAQTGMATGVAWGVLYNLYAQLDRFVTVKTHRFAITPVFNSQGYCVAFSGTLKVRPAQLIAIGMIVLWNYLKVNRKYKKAVY